jgi:hypothetical protein
MSSLLGGNSDLLSTVLYFVALLLSIFGFGYFVYWAAKRGAKQGIREELAVQEKAKLDKSE